MSDQINHLRNILMKKILTFIAILLFTLYAQSLKADDGMWLPHQMKMLNLQEQGLKMDPNSLFKEDGTGLMSAVVHLGGGTGEFVSKDGLILTNHHVAFRAIQRASSTKNDYITNGFIAPERSQEISAQGYIADVLLGYDDITDQVLAVLKPDMTFAERESAIDKIQKKLIEKEEKKGSDLKAKIASMYSGNKYYLFRFKHLKDVRLVYAPPRDLGNFGGNIDNWMWPRHTCDFTFLRAYVSKDGLGEAYSEDNVPYNPKSVMKISLDGLKEGDFNFVMGYPGRTYRNYTLTELVNSMEDLKTRHKEYAANIRFFDKEGEQDKDVEIKYAGTVKSLNNALKNYEGKLEGMEKINLQGMKKKNQDKIVEWIESNPVNKEKYGSALADINKFLLFYNERSLKNGLLEGLVSSRYSSTLLAEAHSIYRAVYERQKKDIDREPNYQNRNWEDLKSKNQLVERGYVPTTDRKFLKFRLKRLMNNPISNFPENIKPLFSKNSAEAIDLFVDDLYDRTLMADPQKRLEMLEMTPKQLHALNDPLIELVAGIEKELKLIREEDKSVNQQYKDLKKTYMAAVLEMKDGKIAPDANSTIRFTYGNVEGYQPADGIYYKAFTTLKGVMEKETGTFPFRVPEKLKDLHQNKNFGQYKDEKQDDIVTCFLNTTNVTGGNSGSATLNAKGEQVGIIFDMTYESVIGDYYVIPELQRTISVDIRYVLFITEKFSGAKFIIDEIGL